MVIALSGCDEAPELYSEISRVNSIAAAVCFLSMTFTGRWVKVKKLGDDVRERVAAASSRPVLKGSQR